MKIFRNTLLFIQLLISFKILLSYLFRILKTQRLISVPLGGLFLVAAFAAAGIAVGGIVVVGIAAAGIVVVGIAAAGIVVVG
ncbi:MAG: hypothetical protein AB1779_11065, partial [Candidatus Thermoplasmatota archaeon]